MIIEFNYQDRDYEVEVNKVSVLRGSHDLPPELDYELGYILEDGQELLAMDDGLEQYIADTVYDEYLNGNE